MERKVTSLAPLENSSYVLSDNTDVLRMDYDAETIAQCEKERSDEELNRIRRIVYNTITEQLHVDE